jgi:Uncharacterized protein conserved in bacteria (DUF2252)
VGTSQYENHGERVVQGQWLMQAASDIPLGWLPALGFDDRQRDFYMRQLWDGKRSIDVESLPPEGLALYARVCGWTLARDARAVGRSDRDRVLPRQSDKFDRAIAEFSELYADQNELDYAALAEAAQSGRIEAKPTSTSPRSPLQLDLELALVAFHLQLDLELDLVGDVDRELHPPALESDLLVVTGQHVRQPPKTRCNLAAGQRLLLLDLEDVHLVSPLLFDLQSCSRAIRPSWRLGLLHRVF